MPNASAGGGRVEVALVSGVVVLSGLVVYGWALEPTAVPLAAAAILTAYVVLARVAGRATRTEPKTLRIAAVCGLLAAGVLIPAVLIEYTGRTVNNGPVFGAAFGLWFAAGVVAGRESGRFAHAVLGATVSGMLTSVANISALFASYYVLRGSALQDRFFQTEGDYADFARSGATNFNAWIIEDMYGALFFHLLLGALIAAVSGAVAGLVAVTVPRSLARTFRPESSHG